MSKIKELNEFRKRVREQREKEWIRSAVKARKFTGLETFQHGMDLIRFAITTREAVDSAQHG